MTGIGDGALGKTVESKPTTVLFYYKTSEREDTAMLVDLLEQDKAVCKEIKMNCELVERSSNRQIFV